MRVHVLAQIQFDNLMKDNKITDENVEKFDSIIFISIVGTEKKEVPYFKKDHKNVMSLRFDDVAHDLEISKTQKNNIRAFTKYQAKKLFNFIKKNREKETCIVHCMAGIARSGAVGIFINGYTRGDHELFKRDNPFVCLNPRVHRMLNAAKYNDFEN